MQNQSYCWRIKKDSRLFQSFAYHSGALSSARDFVTRYISACLIVIYFGISHAFAQQVELLDPLGNRVERISISLLDSENDGKAQFQLRLAEGATESRDVRLSGILQPGGHDLSFEPDSVNLPAGGGTVPIVVSVSGIDDPAVYVAPLLMEGDQASIGSIIVLKAGILTVRGTGENGIQLTHPVPEFSRTFTITSTSPSQMTIRVLVNDFLSETSVASRVAITRQGNPYNGEEVNIAAMGTLDFVISATLTAAGAHQSLISLRYRAGGIDKKVDVPLSVTRTNVSPAIVMEDLDPIRLTRGFLKSSMSVPLRISIRETGGRLQDINEPAIVNLFETEDENRIAVSGWNWQVDSSTWSGPLQPYENRIVEGTIAELRQAGQLTARIRLSDSTGNIIDKDVTIWARWSGWYAALFIFLGVCISEVLRWWFKVRLKQLQDRIHILELKKAVKYMQEHLPKPPPAGAFDLIMAIELELDSAYEKTQSLLSDEITDEFMGLLVARIDLLARWIAAAVMADVKKVRKKYKGEFSKLKQMLESGIKNQSELTTAKNEMSKLEQKIEAEPSVPTDKQSPSVPFELVLSVPSLASLRWQLFIERLAINLGLVIIAVVIGMNLLYVNDLTWGGWSDTFIAILWGLGLHAVGGSQFGGIQGLRQKYESQAGT